MDYADLGHIYSKEPGQNSDSRKKAILKSLEDERRARRACIAQGKKFKIDSFDTPGSPLSLNDEIRPLKMNPSSAYDLPFSKLPSQSSEMPKSSDSRPEFMHNQLREPDFEHLSHIYENYLKSPKITPTVELAVKKTPKKIPNTSRSSSAPNTRRKTTQDLIKDREEDFKRNCTFKPQINKLRYNKDLNYNDNPNNLSLEQKLNQLSKPKSDVIEKREKMRRDKEMIEDSECTFKPCITPYKQINKSFSEYPVDERLYQDAEMKLNERERVKREKEDEIAAQYPFSPQVQSSVAKINGGKRERPPLYQRLEEVQKEINERKKIIRLEAERNDPDLTFHPQINSNSAYLAQAKKSREQNSSRNESVERRQKLMEQYSLDDKYTFTPQISISPSGNAQDFLERQKALQEKLRLKREQMVERLQKSYTFKPNIDRTSQYIADSNRERSREKTEDRLNKDGQKKIELHSHLQSTHYAQYTYEPKINPISKRLGRSSSLSEIAYSQSVKEAKKRIAEEKAAEQEKICSFTPRINSSEKFKNITSQYKQTDNISLVINEQIVNKQQKNEIIKKTKEYEFMRDCTFTPQGVGKKINMEAKVKVKGMDRFMELREIARRQEEEQREREEKAFLLNPSSNPDGSYTIPRPFNLHPSTKHVKIEKLKQELSKKELQECVFRPQTNE